MYSKIFYRDPGKIFKPQNYSDRWAYVIPEPELGYESAVFKLCSLIQVQAISLEPGFFICVSIYLLRLWVNGLV